MLRLRKRKHTHTKITQYMVVHRNYYRQKNKNVLFSIAIFLGHHVERIIQVSWEINLANIENFRCVFSLLLLFNPLTADELATYKS